MELTHVRIRFGAGRVPLLLADLSETEIIIGVVGVEWDPVNGLSPLPLTPSDKLAVAEKCMGEWYRLKNHAPKMGG